MIVYCDTNFLVSYFAENAANHKITRAAIAQLIGLAV
jgi:hypothetical protein